jgi:hypothetical protein
MAGNGERKLALGACIMIGVEAFRVQNSNDLAAGSKERGAELREDLGKTNSD